MFGLAQVRARSALDDIASEEEVRERFPRTSAALELLGEVIHEAVDEIECILCGQRGSRKDEEVDRILEDGMKRVLESLDRTEDESDAA